jgi:hypothetical protein
MQKTEGQIGFTIPIQTLTTTQEVAMTPTAVMAWQRCLPVDLGQSAKKIYHAISDCNKVDLPATDRFEILELIDTSVQYICQRLEQHYINEPTGLTPQQLTITQLAESLQQKMADGYKLVVEQSTDDKHALNPMLLPVALYKIIRCFTQIVLINYERHSIPQKGIWRELHLVYQYAEKKSLLKTNNIEEEYKRVLILAATYPYQRRQSEQAIVYKATESWSGMVTLQTNFKNTTEPASFVVNLEHDAPPTFLMRERINFSDTCKILDVHILLNHLKTLLASIGPNELQARISHNQDPEYAVPAAVLRRIIKAWETPLTRLNNRESENEPVQISIGFLATHFYLNEQRPFQAHLTSGESENFTLTFSTLDLQADGTTQDIENNKILPQTSEIEKITTYPLYPCTLVDKSPNGYGLVWTHDTYPPMQSGEIIGLAIDDHDQRRWEICAIRWLLTLTRAHFKIGIERLSKHAEAAAVQLMKDGQPSGYLARCLILESTLLTPAFPFKTGHHVIIISDKKPALEVELTQLVDSTSVYNQFHYTTHSATDKSPTIPIPTPTSSAARPANPETGEDIFDSIWPTL